MRINEERFSNLTVAVLLAAFWLHTVISASMAHSAPLPPGQQAWEQMQQHAFDVSDGGTLRVRVDDADIAVGATASGAAHIEISLRSNEMEWARSEFEKMSFQARLDGNTVVIESDGRQGDSWRRGRWMSVRVEVRIPERFALELETRDGDVSLGSFAGDARIRSQDGDLLIESLEGAEIELWSQDGDVKAASLRGDTVKIGTQDGDILVESIAGDVFIDTQDGDVRIAAADSSRMSLASGDGDIEVAISEAGNFNLGTNDGDISIIAPAALQANIDFSGDNVEIHDGFTIDGRVGNNRTEGRINGGGDVIRARAGDGTIRLVVRN